VFFDVPDLSCAFSHDAIEPFLDSELPSTELLHYWHPKQFSQGVGIDQVSETMTSANTQRQAHRSHECCAGLQRFFLHALQCLCEVPDCS